MLDLLYEMNASLASSSHLACNCSIILGDGHDSRSRKPLLTPSPNVKICERSARNLHYFV